jgi:predicted RNA-binding Zn ribbon-like protein
MNFDKVKTNKWVYDAGKLPLDFANTADWHASTQPKETLENYSDLVIWSFGASILKEKEARTLLIESEAHPQQSGKILAKAINLREAIYRIFSQIAINESPEAVDIEYLNDSLSTAHTHLHVVRSPAGFEWGWKTKPFSFERMLWPISRAAGNLLTSKDIYRVGQCQDDRGCGYLFFDTSRNHSRRWCSMESCGNRAKAQRYYKRRPKTAGR